MENFMEKLNDVNMGVLFGKLKTLNRAQAEENFNNILGWDPMTYYDRSEIEAMVDEELLDPDYEGKEYCKQNIVNRAYDKWLDRRETSMHDCVEEACMELIDVTEDDGEWNDDEWDDDEDWDEIPETLEDTILDVDEE